jgi:carbon-monoxide dehydrogenase medium subunit
MTTDLGADELILGIWIPKPSANVRFGFHKICRKSGEFADAIGVAALNVERTRSRLVASTAAGPPIVLDGDVPLQPDEIKRRLRQAGHDGDTYDLGLATAALGRAAAAASAA